MQSSPQSKRDNHGSILVLTMIVGGLLLFFCLVAFCFYLLLSQHKKGQAGAEQTAVNMAKVLNETDRVGQINNVIARSRELVYLSRYNENQANVKRLETWEPLARYLVDESRSGAQLVEAERKNQIEVTKKAIHFFADHQNLQASEKPVFSLPFWHTWDSEISEVTLGSSTNTQSNVVNSDIYPELRHYDEHQKYFQKDSNLYSGNINAKLPTPDSDLDFKFAALPAPVENTIAPARLIKQSAFVPAATIFEKVKFVNKPMDQIPTALRVTQLIWITAMSHDENQMMVASQAATTGAMPPPHELPPR